MLSAAIPSNNLTPNQFIKELLKIGNTAEINAFIAKYRASPEFAALNARYSANSNSLDDIETICYALVTNDIATITNHEKLLLAIKNLKNNLALKPLLSGLKVTLVAITPSEHDKTAAMESAIRKTKSPFINLSGDTTLLSATIGRLNDNNTSLDLPNANLENVQLRGVQLGDSSKNYGANLAYANLKGANLEGVIQEPREFRWRYSRNCNLQGANLENANLKNAILKGSNLYNANLANANLEGADLRFSHFNGANLTNVNLTGTDLYDCSFVDARFFDGVTHATIGAALIHIQSFRGGLGLGYYIFQSLIAHLDASPFFEGITLDNIDAVLTDLHTYRKQLNIQEVYQLRRAVAQNLTKYLIDSVNNKTLSLNDTFALMYKADNHPLLKPIKNSFVSSVITNIHFFNGVTHLTISDKLTELGAMMKNNKLHHAISNSLIQHLDKEDFFSGINKENINAALDALNHFVAGHKQEAELRHAIARSLVKHLTTTIPAEASLEDRKIFTGILDRASSHPIFQHRHSIQAFFNRIRLRYLHRFFKEPTLTRSQTILKKGKCEIEGAEASRKAMR